MVDGPQEEKICWLTKEYERNDRSLYGTRYEKEWVRHRSKGVRQTENAPNHIKLTRPIFTTKHEEAGYNRYRKTRVCEDDLHAGERHLGNPDHHQRCASGAKHDDYPSDDCYR